MIPGTRQLGHCSASRSAPDTVSFLLGLPDPICSRQIHTKLRRTLARHWRENEGAHACPCQERTIFSICAGGTCFASTPWRAAEFAPAVLPAIVSPPVDAEDLAARSCLMRCASEWQQMDLSDPVANGPELLICPLQPWPAGRGGSTAKLVRLAAPHLPGQTEGGPGRVRHYPTTRLRPAARSP